MNAKEKCEGFIDTGSKTLLEYSSLSSPAFFYFGSLVSSYPLDSLSEIFPIVLSPFSP